MPEFKSPMPLSFEAVFVFSFPWSGRGLDDGDLLVGQTVQFVHELVNLAVDDVDLALECDLLVVGIRRSKLFLEREHRLDKRDHPVVPGFVGGVGEIDDSYRELLNILTIKGEISPSKRSAYIPQIDIEQTGI